MTSEELAERVGRVRESRTAGKRKLAARHASAREQRAIVLQALLAMDNEPIMPSEVVLLINDGRPTWASKTSATKAAGVVLWTLKRKGLVEASEYGRYRLTAAGITIAQQEKIYRLTKAAKEFERGSP